jgi:hypothetical protein
LFLVRTATGGALPTDPIMAEDRRQAKQAVLDRVNTALVLAGLNDTVWSIRDCDSTLFVLMYKKLVGKVRHTSWWMERVPHARAHARAHACACACQRVRARTTGMATLAYALVPLCSSRAS